MNKSASAVSILFIGLTFFFLIFSIFSILYFYWGDLKVIQDSLSTTGSIFGAIATLGAAAVAAYLFNDWKEQHNKQVQNSFALQVFDFFSVFENNILEYSMFISHLQDLRSSYENYELTWEILNKDGNTIYIQNIGSKKDELDLSFYRLMSKLKNYYIFNHDIYDFNKKHETYFNKFIEINKSLLPTNTLVEELIEYEAKLIGYKDLKNMIDILDISPIIQQLNAK
ncbi:hypothetical protein J7S89_03465 [Acinetobacter baumannii]|uniref:hypothetical protein n=1 Tax=Acinetobacter baumannii TaxID=470 RepID=UPI00044E63FD|nr:hypothetical protein [Acinetobacter baumannii]AVF08369.1 hypothetical protein AM457_12790 [Acinetobacter baumannii]EKV6442035.1 hypothetical protein [Acinetobacter baumannii]EXG13668.1 hypothetical protein J727_3052 [Acinetobacter baumannii 472237-120]EXH18784.1 hypothetical protein J636_1214 [Acinetobacter baumannii 1271213]EXR35454.1 hypothetical protein J668_3701 [Acinetobacter baumannii 1276470-86]